MISSEQIREAVAQTLVKASTTFRLDQIAAYERAIKTEQDSKGRWVLEQILENSQVAASKGFPLCDDTGIPHVFVEIGDEMSISGKDLAAIEEGITDGLRNLPARPMAVKGEGLDRLGQKLGMYDDPGMLAAAPFSIRRIPGDKLRITVLMFGGGPEIRGKTLRVFHRHQGENVIKEVIKWIEEGAQALGCTPCIPIIGIGRSQYEAGAMLLEAAAYGDFNNQSSLENFITTEVNKSGVGPLGLGKDTTVLGTFLKIGPARASGVRVVSLRLGCCFDPRRATIEL